MNVLMIRPDAVLVETEETPIQKMFESLGIKCIKVSLILKEMKILTYYVAVKTCTFYLRHRFDLRILSEEVFIAGQPTFADGENSRGKII